MGTRYRQSTTQKSDTRSAGPNVAIHFKDCIRETANFMLERRHFKAAEAYMHLETLYPGKYYSPQEKWYGPQGYKRVKEVLKVLKRLGLVKTQGTDRKGWWTLVNVCLISDSAVEYCHKRSGPRLDKWIHVQEVWNQMVFERGLVFRLDSGPEFLEEDSEDEKQAMTPVPASPKPPKMSNSKLLLQKS